MSVCSEVRKTVPPTSMRTVTCCGGTTAGAASAPLMDWSIMVPTTAEPR